MNRSQSPPRRQRACVQCSKAKARCHFIGEQQGCERCEKMSIQCVAKTTRSLRKPRQIKPLNSRVSSLEQRLETLVSALEGHDATAAAATTAVSAPPAASAGFCAPDIAGPALAIRTPESVVTPGSATRDDAARKSISQRQETCDDPQKAQRARQPPVHPEAPPPLGVTWPQAERVLTIFRERYMFNFPFVIVEHDVSARRLLEEKPFLFRAIMLVAAPLPVPRKTKMKRNVMAYLGTRLLVEEEEEGNLELLQGLLVTIAWVDFDNIKDKKITTLTYMALGFAHNLGITKIPLPVLRQLGMGDVPEDIRSSKVHIATRVHSAEEQRAFLGCYNLLAANSAQFGRINPLGSQYVSLCCDALDWTRGYPSDFFLERTIRLIHMGEKIDAAFGAAIDCARPKPYLFLVEGSARGFRVELDSIMESLGTDQMHYESVYGPIDGTDNVSDRRKCFTLYYHYLLVRLYEPATYLPEASQEGGAPSMYRSLCLRNCLFAVKAFFDTLLELHSTQHLFNSLNIMQQTTFVMIIATRLLLIDSPDWDVEFARLTLDFVGTLRGAIAKAKAAEAARADSVMRFVEEMGVLDVTPEELEAPGQLDELAKKTAMIVEWFERRLEDETQGRGGDVGEGAILGLEYNRMQSGGDAFSFDLNSGGAPLWIGGLLSNQAWNFDDIDI